MDGPSASAEQPPSETPARPGWRRRLACAGALLLAPAAFLLLRPGLGAVPAGAMAVLAGLAVAFLLGPRPSRSSARTLALFDQGQPVDLSSQDMQRHALAAVSAAEGPQCLVHLQGVALPRGGWRSAVLRLGPSSADLEVRSAAWDRAAVPVIRRATLAIEPLRDLQESLASDFDSLESAHRFPVRDGVPCDLVIGLRDPVRVRRWECNLADPRKDRPVVRLARRLWDLAAPLAEGSGAVGTCDAHGRIDIRRV